MGGKKSLLLIPGLICTRALWGHQIGGLSDIADISVADHRGSPHMARLAKKVLAAAPARFALCGQSMGGYIALEIMRQAPQRVSKLALIATTARADPPHLAKIRRETIRMVGKGRFRGMSDGLVKTFVHPDHLSDTNLIDTLYQMAKETGPEAFVRQSKAVLSRPDGCLDLQDIDCPTLVLCGDSDTRTPPELHEELARLISGAKLVILKRCGHLPPLEKPDETTGHLRAWLLRS